jgi:hypothetical protein
MRLILGLCALLFASSVFATGARVFQNFTNNASGWSALDPTNYPWSVVPGATGYYRNDTASTGTAESITLYTSSQNLREWEDNFVYSFDIYSSSGGTDDQLGAIFGYTSAGNYYEVVTNVQGQVTVRRYEGGAESWHASGSVPGFSANTFVPVRLSLMMGRLSLKIGGQDTTFYNGLTDVGVTPISGRIGLVARNEIGRFDNVNIVERIFRGNFTDADTGLGLHISDDPPYPCSTNSLDEITCYARISGKDTSGYSWPIQMWGNDVDPNKPEATGAALQYIPHITSGDVKEYLSAAIERQTGHGGTVTHVLHQRIMMPGTSGNETPQIPFVIHPLNTFAQQHDLYVRFWLEYPNGLDGGDPNGTHSWWQMPFQIRTENNTLRLSLFAANTPTHNGEDCDQLHNPPNNPPAGRWHWLIQGDKGKVGSGESPYWQSCNPTAEVPMGQWFKVEIFFHRAPTLGSSGRVWVAIAGQEVLDYTVPADTIDKGTYASESPIDRIMLPQMYGGDFWPRDQYVDDLEIWNWFPPDASPDLE